MNIVRETANAAGPPALPMRKKRNRRHKLDAFNEGYSLGQAWAASATFEQLDQLLARDAEYLKRISTPWQQGLHAAATEFARSVMDEPCASLVEGAPTLPVPTAPPRLDVPVTVPGLLSDYEAGRVLGEAWAFNTASFEALERLQQCAALWRKLATNDRARGIIDGALAAARFIGEESTASLT
jgi:hypothetical protein